MPAQPPPPPHNEREEERFNGWIQTLWAHACNDDVAGLEAMAEAMPSVRDLDNGCAEVTFQTLINLALFGPLPSPFTYPPQSAQIVKPPEPLLLAYLFYTPCDSVAMLKLLTQRLGADLQTHRQRVLSHLAHNQRHDLLAAWFPKEVARWLVEEDKVTCLLSCAFRLPSVTRERIEMGGWTESAAVFQVLATAEVLLRPPYLQRAPPPDEVEGFCVQARLSAPATIHVLSWTLMALHSQSASDVAASRKRG
jgi:hypothetical protein